MSWIEIDKYLKNIKNSGLSRIQKVNNNQVVSFASNDYLGLSAHPKILQAIRHSPPSKFCGSKYLGGYDANHQAIERQLSRINNTEGSIIFGSGYMANIGTIAAMMKICPLIILDKKSHASIIDGIALGCSPYQPPPPPEAGNATAKAHEAPVEALRGQAPESATRPQKYPVRTSQIPVFNKHKIARYNHQDYNHLEQILQNHAPQSAPSRQLSTHEDRPQPTRLIITESIFSITGTKSNIGKLINIAEKYNCYLMIDTAHSLGITELSPHKAQDRCIFSGNFSKALALIGGYISSSNQIIEYLTNAARAQIYSSALPQCITSGITTGLEIILQAQASTDPHNSSGVSASPPILNAQFFWEELGKFNTTEAPIPKPESQIVFIETPSIPALQCISSLLSKEGFEVATIRPPTSQKPGIRLSFTANHSKREISALSKALAVAIKSQKHQSPQKRNP